MSITLCQLLTRFFRNHLAAERNLSSNTIASYSTCMQLFLEFCCRRLSIPLDGIDLNRIDQALVLDFLDHLERDRQNVPATRNQRLTALKTFFRFIAIQNPDLAELCERIAAIRSKHTEDPVIEPLSQDQIKAILAAPRPDTPSGRRDQALLNFMYNTGARAQEVADLQLGQIRGDAASYVLLNGKGRKQRLVPIWPETVNLLKTSLADRPTDQGDPTAPLFQNAAGQPFTRFGIAQRLKVHTARAARACPSLTDRQISPHTIRHTTALHLLQAGVDIVQIKEWLGHADLKTTSRYLQIDLDMKRQALDKLPPPLKADSGANPAWQVPQTMAFLKQLSRPRQARVMCSPALLQAPLSSSRTVASST